MKIAFVAIIIRNSLCMIYGILLFFQKFLLKITFWLLRSIGYPGIHCILVLFVVFFHEFILDQLCDSHKKIWSRDQKRLSADYKGFFTFEEYHEIPNTKLQGLISVCNHYVGSLFGDKHFFMLVSEYHKLKPFLVQSI